MKASKRASESRHDCSTWNIPSLYPFIRRQREDPCFSPSAISNSDNGIAPCFGLTSPRTRFCLPGETTKQLYGFAPYTSEYEQLSGKSTVFLMHRQISAKPSIPLPLLTNPRCTKFSNSWSYVATAVEKYRPVLLRVWNLVPLQREPKPDILVAPFSTAALPRSTSFAVYFEFWGSNIFVFFVVENQNILPRRTRRARRRNDLKKYRPVRLARLQPCALAERTKVGYHGSAAVECGATGNSRLEPLMKGCHLHRTKNLVFCFF